MDIAANWQRVPVILRAAVLGLGISFVGSTLAVVPLVLNLKFARALPWSLPIVLGITFAFWWWACGHWLPKSGGPRRRYLSRTDKPFRLGPSLLPTLAATLLVVAMRLVAPFFIPVPAPTFKAGSFHLSELALACGVLAIAVSSGVVEEIAFRGYAQRLLEDRFGVLIACLVGGVLFWIAHLPDVTIAHLPGQVIASLVFGYLAVATRSLVPPIIAHVGADIVLQSAYAFRSPNWIWKALTARPVWESPATPTAESIGLAILPTRMGLPNILFWIFAGSVVLFAWSILRQTRAVANDPLSPAPTHRQTLSKSDLD